MWPRVLGNPFRSLGNRGGATGMSAAQFAALIAATSPLAWWDANRDLYTDTGLTTPVVNDGDAVAGWKDQSGNGYHVLQSTAGDRPLYRASVSSINNKPAVEFVSSDYLIKTALGAPILGNLSTYTIFVVFRTTTAAQHYTFTEGNSASGNSYLGPRLTTAAAEFIHVSDAPATATASGGTTANNGNRHIHTVRRISAASWAVRLDGTQVATDTTNISTTTTNQVAIGARARSTIATFFTGHIAQVILSNSNNFATVEPILAAYYGINLP